MTVILRDYESFLTKKENIKFPNIPYYLKWVSDCYRFLNESEFKRLSSDQKKQFLSQMAKNHEDWQVKQACVHPCRIEEHPGRAESSR